MLTEAGAIHRSRSRGERIVRPLCTCALFRPHTSSSSERKSSVEIRGEHRRTVVEFTIELRFRLDELFEG